ncbi:MAG: hypothetical protein WDN48_11355 [Pseudolabrys sp.]
MAKLSDLFGRKGGEPDKFPSHAAPTRNGNGNGGSEHIHVEHFSDVGSRMGEENEVLRNLLTDTGRKIGELDELKEAFDKIVAPFNSTLRALEQEKSQTLGLTGMLAESRASYETLRTEFYQIERKATALEAETERLREDLELSRESNRGLESNRIELANEISTRSSQIAELERQLAQESAERRSVSEARRTLQDQFDVSEKRIGELEGELAAAREKLALLEDEKRSLQLAVDGALNETARLTRRLTETENTLTATRAQLGKVESSFAEAYAERGRLGAALDEAKEQHQAERNSLNMRLDALQSRAATAERLLSEARQNLLARTEEVRAFDRKSVEATIGRNNAEKAPCADRSLARSARAPDQGPRSRPRRAHRTQQCDQQDAEVARDLARPCEEKIAALTERNGHLEADVQISRTNIEKRVEDLNSALQRERMERAVIEGALEARARTIRGCKAKSARCARRCAAACRSTKRRCSRPKQPTTSRPKARRPRAPKPPSRRAIRHIYIWNARPRSRVLSLSGARLREALLFA